MSSRRHRVVHRTVMRYEGEVITSHNELRMIPVDEPGQATLESRVRVRPLTWSNTYRDHWGTQVMVIEAQTPHTALEIEATSTVERSDLAEPTEAVSWEQVRDEEVQDRLSEFLTQTARTTPAVDVRELAEQAAHAATPGEAALAFAEQVHESLTYEPGITGWQSTAIDVWEHRHGVCQDFAHVTLGGLRAIGVPARYVSGYITTDAAEIARGSSAAAQNHAWIEVWDGDWRPIDATNPGSVGLNHVVLGRGRDYDDVSPFRGMFVGQGLADLDLEITYTRLD